jgi:DNA-binding NarL/FixJ family response regulator
MTNLDQVKVSPREQQVLNLLVHGCSNKEIGSQLNISPRTVRNHLRMLFLRSGIREGDKRVKLARYAHEDEGAVMTLQVIKNHLRSAFDKLGVWSRLELAMYVADHGGKGRLTETERGNPLGTLERFAPILTPLTFHS